MIDLATEKQGMERNMTRLKSNCAYKVYQPTYFHKRTEVQYYKLTLVQVLLYQHTTSPDHVAKHTRQCVITGHGTDSHDQNNDIL